MRTNPADATLRNLRAQRKRNEKMTTEIEKLKLRVSDLERALRYVLKYARGA